MDFSFFGKYLRGRSDCSRPTELPNGIAGPGVVRAEFGQELVMALEQEFTAGFGAAGTNEAFTEESQGRSVHPVGRIEIEPAHVEAIAQRRLGLLDPALP